MKDERIIISFDDEIRSKKIEIDIDDINAVTEKITQRNVRSLGIHSDSGLTNYYDSKISYPSGIDSGFRVNFKTDLEDNFLNSILYNQHLVALSSCTGKMYFLGLEDGKLKSRLDFDGEIFERTGVVFNDYFYINSVQSIFEVTASGIQIERDSIKQIYETPHGFYIWSNLNNNDGLVSFVEVNPDEKKYSVVMFDINTKVVVYKQLGAFKNYINGELCLFNKEIYFNSDNKLFSFNADELIVSESFDIQPGATTVLATDKRRMYIACKDGSVKCTDSGNRFINAGFSVSLANSIAVVKDALLFGNPYGWCCYNSNGVKLYEHDDSDENIVRAVSDKIIVISKKNKVIMHNAEKFVEAEGIVIKRSDDEKISEIISVVFSDNAIISLTKDGILFSISNDKLNINV